MGDGPFTDADIEYVRASFRSLEGLCRERAEAVDAVRAAVRARRLPAPSYVLPDGAEMVPEDYFQLVDEAGGPDHLRAEFERRYEAAGGVRSEFEQEWEGYIGGLYGVCLRRVSPETIVRKGELVSSIERLLERPAPDDAGWRARLRDDVDELDALERQFSPDFDRQRFDRPPSRDVLIAAAHRQYPDLFAAAA